MSHGALRGAPGGKSETLQGGLKIRGVVMTKNLASCKFACSLLVCLAVLFLCVSPMWAQSGTTGALTGTVTDSSGGVIVGATVTATSLGTGQERTATTDSTGTYKFSLLAAGNYSLKFAASGFKTAQLDSVTVNITATAVLNQRLEVGAQSEHVTVEATAETLQTENVTNGTLVGSKEINDLPLSGRNYTQIIDLSPGVVANVATASAVGNGTQDINVNGSGSDQNNYIMDGVSQTNYGSGGGAQSGNFPGIGIPNPDSIQEFKIQTSQFDAGYGRNPGASVSVTTKSGTNSLHGSAWEFFRNSFLDGNDKFNKQGEVTFQEPNKPQALSQNEFGGALGGPIKKDKLFFFGSYQGFRQKNGIGSNGFGTGVASDVTLLPFNEPDGTRKDETGSIPLNYFPGAPACNYTTYRSYLGCVFGGTPYFGGPTSATSCNPFFITPPTPGLPTCNTGLGTGVTVAPDGSNINQVAVNLLQAPGSKGKFNNGFYMPSIPFSGGSPVCNWQTSNCAVSLSVPIIASEDQYLGNADWVMNAKNTLSEKYFFSRDPQSQSFVCLGIFNPAANQCLPGAPEDVTYTATNAILKLTTIVTSNIVNEVHTSFQRQTTVAVGGSYVSACSVGIIPVLNAGAPCPEANPSANPVLNQIPTFSIGGFVGGTGGGWNQGGNFFASATNFFNTYEAADNVSWNHGKHTVRTGFEYDRIQYNWTLPSRGGFGFLNSADFLTSSSGAPDTGTAPGVNTGGVTINFQGLGQPNGNKHYLRVNGFNAFVQDDIKVTSKLTVNVGVRWEYDGWPSDAKGIFTNTWASQAEINNTGSFFLGNQVAKYAGGLGDPTQANQIGTLSGFVVQSNYNPNAPVCGTYTAAGPCGYAAPAGVFQSTLNGAQYTYVGGATGVLTNTNKTLMGGFPAYAFAPRFGVAWQPVDKMVVRAGYGIFYDRVYANLLANNQAGNPPYAGTVPQPPAGSSNAPTLDNPDPVPGTFGWTPRTLWVNGGSAATGATTILGLNGGVGIGGSSDSQFLQVPLIQEYTLDMQYQLGHNWVADIGYVGTHGTHLYDWNRPVNVGLLVPGAPNGPTDPQNEMMVVGSGFRGTPASLPFNDPNNTNPATQVLENTTGNVAGRVSYLGFGTGSVATTGTYGDSLYNSLQASLKHQFANGIFVQASYTWSKLITNVNASVSGAGIAAGGNVLSGNAGSNDPLNLGQQYGLAAFNRPQRLVIAYTYNLPWMHTEGLSGKAFGGWSISGVTTIQDGNPFTVVDSRAGLIYYGAGAPPNASIPFGSSDGRAELASAGNCNGFGVCRSTIPIATSGSNDSRLNDWINPNAFQAPPCIGGMTEGECATSGGSFGWGNSAVGSISGPGQNNWDFSIMKNTPLKEGITMQFRTEFYNVWNHAQFNPPNNNLETFTNSPITNQFGVITSSSVPPRVIQFALKFLF